MVHRRADSILILGAVQPLEQNKSLIPAQMDYHVIALNWHLASIAHQPSIINCRLDTDRCETARCQGSIFSCRWQCLLRRGNCALLGNRIFELGSAARHHERRIPGFQHVDDQVREDQGNVVRVRLDGRLIERNAEVGRPLPCGR